MIVASDGLVKLRNHSRSKTNIYIMINIYKNLGGNSSVRAYEIMPTSINVQFNSGKWYSYSFLKAGQTHVENMKALATKGIGLCSYIQRFVKYLYD